MTQQPDGPKVTFIGKLIIFLIIAGCFYGAYYLFFRGPGGFNFGGGSNTSSNSQPTDALPPSNNSTGTSSSAAPLPPGEMVEIGISYGTEKQRWLQDAASEFAKTAEGKSIKINLIPMGSLEGAQAILKEDKRIHVWTPASSLYKDILVQEWQLKNNTNPIAKEEVLALSPMVFVMWDERYQAFMQKYKAVTFNTLAQALAEKGGWDAIAGKPDWGLFKIGHTNPGQSNSGVATLVLMAYDYHNKSRNLTMKDTLDTDFQNWLTTFERGVTGMSNSTGNMMKDMVLRGPSSYDCLVVYESVAIDYLKNAEGRWGKLRVVYPKYNMWNDNPYYIVDVPWSSKPQRQAAEAFLRYLMSQNVQKQSLTHGFRPGDPAVPIKFPQSPFVLYQPFGLEIDLSTICETPKAEVINNLLTGWQRSSGSK